MSVRDVAPAARSAKITAYGSAYETLIAGLREFPKEMWHFRDEHGCWSIHEHLVHITDSEVNSYIRCRRLIAEPGEPLMAYDENGWATAWTIPTAPRKRRWICSGFCVNRPTT